MATLFNTKISATYPGLLKTIDNTALSATLRELTDGSGNQSGLFLNTAGDFKVTSVLEWGSLKDTGTGVTITQFVTAANGIENFNNDTTLPTSAAVKLYVDTKFSQTDTLTEVLGFGNTTSGKDIAVSAGDDITFTDTSKAIFGVGSDLQIYHNGSDSFIQNTGNDLKVSSNIITFQKPGLSEFMANFYADGANEFFFDGSKKIETVTDGAKVTGNLVVTGSITGAGGSFLPLAGGTMTGVTRHGDSVISYWGTGDDLAIYHDGLHSYLQDTGAGDLRIKTNGASIAMLSPLNEDMILAVPNSFVKLYFDGSEKLATTATGASVTGNLVTTANVNVGANATFVDNGKAIFGAGGDLEIFHDGTHSRIKDVGAGNLTFNATDFIVNNSADSKQMMTAVDGGAVSLFFNASKKIETLTDGAKVSGNLEVTGTITGAGGSFLPLIGGTMTGNTIHNDNVKSIYGTGSDLEIFHDGSNSYINEQGTGNLYLKATSLILSNSAGSNYLIGNSGNSVNLFFNGSQKFATTNTGISVTGNVVTTGSVIIPDAGQLQLGTGNDAQITHDSSAFYAQNFIGQLNIEQRAVTESIVVKVSNSNAADTTALTINRQGDLITGKDVTIAGDLTVNGTTTTVNSQTLSVVDPLISLATANTANSLDIGFYGKYNDSTNRYLGLFNDASDSNKFKLFRGTTVEPTTTVNVAGAGYVAADLVVAGLEASSFTNTGDLLVEDNIYLTDAGTTRAKIQLNSSDRDNLDIKAVSLGSTMNLFTADTLALGLDAAQNATFAGNVTIDNGTNSTLIIEKDATGNGKIQFNDAGSQQAYIALDAAEDMNFYAASGNDQVFYAGGVLNETKSGALSTFAGDVNLADNKAILFGGGGKAFIKHSSTDMSIFNDTGNIFITNRADNKDIRFSTDNGSGGTTTYFTIDGLNEINQFSKNVSLPDNVIAKFGNSSDLQIKHDGNNSKITESGTGGLYIGSNLLGIQNGSHNETMAVFTADDSVDLYYNNVKKFETTSIGISVTGSINAEGLQVSSNITTPLIQLKGDLNVLNKAQTSYLTLADRDTSGSEVLYNLANVGSATFTVPSAGGSFINVDHSGNESWTIAAQSGVGADDYLDIGISGGNRAMSWHETGNVGIGTTTPVGKVEVLKNGGTSDVVITSDTLALLQLKDSSLTKHYNIEIGRSSSAGDLTFRSVSGEKVRFTEAGNVGIGTTIPLAKLHVKDGSVLSSALGNTSALIEGFNQSILQIASHSTGYSQIAFGDQDDGFDGGFIYSNASRFLSIEIANAERMRITSAGELLIGSTSYSDGANNVGILNGLIRIGANTTSSKVAMYFTNPNGVVGAIVTSGSATAFTTSSDYRLKEDLQDFTGLDMVSKIPVYDFKWKVDKSRSYGVMAHELQEVLPDAVSGEKDAEEYQGVDYSKIVPVLVKAIQELKAEIELLKAK